MHLPELLLLTNSSESAARLAPELRGMGFLVRLGRTYEPGADALERVSPEVVLIERGHEAASSDAFQQRVHRDGCIRVVFTAKPRATPAAMTAQVLRDDCGGPDAAAGSPAAVIAVMRRVYDELTAAAMRR